jgi:hypothetical protein
MARRADGHASTGIEHDVQAALALETGVKPVERLADPGGKIRHGRAPPHDGDGLFGNLL